MLKRIHLAVMEIIH